MVILASFPPTGDLHKSNRFKALGCHLESPFHGMALNFIFGDKIPWKVLL